MNAMSVAAPTTAPIPARPAPRQVRRPLTRRLFGSPLSALLTIVIGALLLFTLPALVWWALLQATPPWAEAAACAQRAGACWPFLVEKAPLILFGTYDYAERWRPALASALLVALAAATLFAPRAPRRLLAAWLAALAAFIVLMKGGVFSLPEVPTARWNGLPVLLFLAAFGLALAFPLGLLLALARAARMTLMASAATALIEFLRGVPMVSVLFFGVFVLPLLVPGGRIDPLYASLAALVLFHAAYVAEDVRGGLQSVPRGQLEGAQSIGLGYWASMRLVVLPQALRAATPALTNTAIGGLKDTSLVVIVGLHDLMSTAKMAYNDPLWQRHALEAYVFVGALFFVMCWALSAAGRRLEQAQMPR
jgi:general L-amino acid transport system permease protein